MLKCWLLIVGLFLIMPLPMRANDSSVVGEGGRWKRMQEGTTTVQMVREKVLLDLDRPHTYSVVADFTFLNHGPATIVKMGFPEFGGGDGPGPEYVNKSGFISFRSTVDGKPWIVKRQKAEILEAEDYSTYWVKTVPFAAGQTRHVQVRYRSEYGGQADLIGNFVSYSFTGGNWWGKVEESVLTVRLSKPGAYLVCPYLATKPVFVRRGADFIYTWHNWQAESLFMFNFAPTLWDWLAWPGGDPRDNGGFAVKIPGKRDENTTDFVPGGFVRDRATYVNLREWLERTKQIPDKVMRSVPDGVSVTSHGKTTVYPTRTGASRDFVVIHGWGNTALFVSAERLKRDFGVNFTVDVKAHRITSSP